MDAVSADILGQADARMAVTILIVQAVIVSVMLGAFWATSRREAAAERNQPQGLWLSHGELDRLTARHRSGVA